MFYFKHVVSYMMFVISYAYVFISWTVAYSESSNTSNSNSNSNSNSSSHNTSPHIQPWLNACDYYYPRTTLYICDYGQTTRTTIHVNSSAASGGGAHPTSNCESSYINNFTDAGPRKHVHGRKISHQSHQYVVLYVWQLLFVYNTLIIRREEVVQSVVE